VEEISLWAMHYWCFILGLLTTPSRSTGCDGFMGFRAFMKIGHAMPFHLTEGDKIIDIGYCIV
jgi:hypothetical protein